MDFIVREKCSEIRILARMMLKDKWKKVAFACGLFYVLLTILPLAVCEIVPAANYVYYEPSLGTNISIPVLYLLYIALLNSAFSVGLYSYLIHLIRRKETNVAHLFDGFEFLLKTIWLNIVITFFIILWSMLFVIPGIIAAIRYSQAFVVLADHPEYSVGQCIGVSKQYMKQNKGKFVCLGLSFTGWAILASIPSMFIPLSLTGLPLLVVQVVANIPYFFFMAYMFTGQVVFYELVSRNLIAMPKEQELPKLSV